jgi:hypothetical protein
MVENNGGKDVRTIIEGGGMSIYASEVKLILLYAKLDEIRVEKCSEKTLSLTADDVLENYWWYAF